MPYPPNEHRPPIVIHIPDRGAPLRKPSGNVGGNPFPSDDPLRRRVMGWLVALTTAGVLFCGMFPFDFVSRSQAFDWTIDQLYTAGDGPENVLFFVPTGFALAALLIRRRGSWASLATVLSIALALGAALSTLVEGSQIHLQSRDPSLADICSNTLGTAVGIGLFLVIGNSVINALWAIGARLDRQLTPTRSGYVAIIWIAIVGLLPLIEHHAGSIADWNPAFPLLLGNETTGNRWWNGTVQSLWIADRAASDAEVDRLLEAGDVKLTLGSAIRAAYPIAGRGPFADETGLNDVLHWKAGSSDDNTSFKHVTPLAARSASQPAEYFPPILMATTAPGAQPLGKDGDGVWWLQSVDGALSPAITKIISAQAFTVVCDLQTSDLEQNARARIVSISQGTSRCNLQLMQEADQLVVRLRTRASGEGGSEPEFMLPDVFLDPAPRRIVVSYDHGQLMVTTDHLSEKHHFRFTPEASLIWKAYPRPGWAFQMDSSGQSACAVIFRILAFVPAGYLIMRCRRTQPQAVWRTLAWMVVAVAVVEAALAVEDGHPPGLSLPLAAICSVTVGMIIAGWDFSPIQQLRRRLTLW